MPAASANTAIAAVDLNTDGPTDFFFGRSNGPSVEAGFKRTFLIDVVGYSKGMDIHLQ